MSGDFHFHRGLQSGTYPQEDKSDLMTDGGVDAAPAADERVLILPSHCSDVYHTDPSCYALGQSRREARWVQRSQVFNRHECGFCASSFEHTTEPWQNGECRSCGAHAPDGECPFCAVFDAIHDVPADADLTGGVYL